MLLSVVAAGVFGLQHSRPARPLLVLAFASVLIPAALATGAGLSALHALVDAVPGLGVLRDVIIADTDEEAYALWRNSGAFVGAAWFEPFHFGDALVDPATGERPTVPEMMEQGLMLVGSPDTVTAKLNDLYEMTGGFGTIVMMAHDVFLPSGPWRWRIVTWLTSPNCSNISPSDSSFSYFPPIPCTMSCLLW